LSGKGKAGLVIRCDSVEEIDRARQRLSHAALSGLGLQSEAVIEEYVDGEEIYFSIAVDEAARAIVVRLDSKGGVGYEAAVAPAQVVRLHDGLHEPILDALVDRAGIQDRELAAQLKDAALRLWTAFVASEASLIEVNPFRWDGKHLRAVGLALDFDPNPKPGSLASRPPLAPDIEVAFGRPPTAREKMVAEADAAEPNKPYVKFFELDGGDVAMLVLGGGASLYCLDYLHRRGISSACYADQSPGSGLSKLAALVTAGLTIPGIRGAIFGAVVVSLADVAEMAQGFKAGLETSRVDTQRIPIVVRLAGPNERKAQAMLASIPGLTLVGREGTLEDACESLIAQLNRPGGLDQ
jgi:succinyl-CoA synthetase beta subunit